MALDGKGRVWTWGANASGQLGQGNLREQALPRHVKLTQPVKAIAAGATHTLALDVHGQLWGWGSNHKKQLSAQIAEAYLPSPVRIGGRLSEVKAVVAGLHFSAVLTREGLVRAWGWNGLGQLGHEEIGEESERVIALKRVRQISAGRSHMLALTEEGTCWAWGDNRFGTCQGEAEMQAQPRQIDLSAMKFQPHANLNLLKEQA